MDSDLEDLESLISDHFGRTPESSQALSSFEEDYQGPDIVHEISDADDTLPLSDVDERTRRFLQEDDSEDTNSDDGTDVQGETALPLDDPDAEKVRMFKQAGCGCTLKCTESLSQTDIYTHVLNMREMDRSDREMYIMATLVDNNDKDTTKRGKKRQRMTSAYNFQGTRVCKRTFMLLFDIGKHSIQSLRKHVDKHGVIPRSHANVGRKPPKALKFENIKKVIYFISNYADEFGLPQPAAPRGRDGTPPIYLHSSMTKIQMHEMYVSSCTEDDDNVRVVKYSTFNNIWRTCLSHIKIATPRDNVCATCEKMRKKIMDAVTEEEKLFSTNDMNQHIANAQKERDTYNMCIKQAKDSNANNDNDKYTHYTFDFSQNLALPHHARQMGPLYFTSLRKVQLFGFRVDGLPRQLNFLIDENETIGKDGTLAHGPNAVISMIHWALQSQGGEPTCTIHADNCPGQNKNRYVIGYFMWRVMTGRHTRVEYMMQVPGHARCLVDAGFASIKRLYRRSDCDTLDQLGDVVNKSSTTNMAVRYPEWQWFDWKAFLEPVFRSLPGISKYQYFRMSSETPGVVIVKKASDADEISVNILRTRGFSFLPDSHPVQIPAGGLSRERRAYMYKSVRPFVRPVHQDITCPQ